MNVREKLSELVGRRIRELGINNAELARRSGLTRGYIGNIVNDTAPTQSGNYNLSPDSVGKLAKALEISEAEILAAMKYLSDPTADVPKPILEALAREGRLSPNDEVLIADFITRLKQTQPESAQIDRDETIVPVILEDSTAIKSSQKKKAS